MVLYSVLFLILAALAPPLILLGIIYRLDQIEREPPGLLWSLFLRGVLAMVPILVLEMLADQFIDFFYWRPMVYLFLAYFVVPGFIEEGIKYRVLRRRTWNEPNFNYRFDGVVYGVFVSLGFAAVENVMYVLTSGFSTAVVRAIFSIPGHAMFGVVMGAALGQAKWLAAHGQGQQAAAFLRRAWLLPAILHGAYDFLLVGFGCFISTLPGWWSMCSACCGGASGRTFPSRGCDGCPAPRAGGLLTQCVRYRPCLGAWSCRGPSQVKTCHVVSRPYPGRGSRLSLGESPDAKSRGGGPPPPLV